MISVVIPAHDEEGFIGDCLDRILQSTDPAPRNGAAPTQVVVVANGCADATANEARARADAFAARGWRLEVLELEQGSKTGAMNAAEAILSHRNRIYMDADVHVTPDLIAQLAAVLNRPDPVFASGQHQIPPARSIVSRLYARFWLRLPFMATGVPGCGVYAVNAAGRARWDTIPEVIADDFHIRSHFDPSEMHKVPATYSWPVAEGFARLVRVRRRQNEGLGELAEKYPDLVARSGETGPGVTQKLGLMLQDPLGMAIYSGVALTVRTPLFRNRTRWERGR